MELEDIVRQIKPSSMDELMIKNEEFTKLFKENKVFLLDVRMDFEAAVWSLGIATNIPAPSVPDRLSELPTDKLIVVGCPTVNRSITVSAYLKTKGFNSRFLAGGLVELMGTLKGGAAKELVGK
ncbi:MAG: rhodanese-like domain-containing protein [Campylobacterota bacterium]|nr:rhodanese-like domain-containing protein [Campylobacterota bacterium]